MYKVLVGAISPEGEHLLTSYLEKFMPDAQVEPLKAAGIKGRMKNHATRQDVLLVILDESLWNACVGVVDTVLSLPKVHKYVSDDGLKSFLVSKFGPLDDVGDTGTIPPDMLMGQAEDEEDEYIPKSSANLSKDSSTGATVPPDSLDEPMMVDDVLPTTEESEEVATTDTPSEVVEKLNSQVRDLQSQLAGKDTLIRSLTLQLNDKKSGEEDDIAALVGRIRELESELSEKDKKLRSSADDNFVNLGKVAKAEQVLADFDGLREQVSTLTADKGAVEKERDNLSAKLGALEAEAAGLREKVATIPELKKSLDEKAKRVTALEQEIEAKSGLIAELESASSDHEGVVSELEQLKSELGVLQKQIDEDKERLKRLDEAEDELSAKQLEIDNLQADIRSLNERLSAQSTDIEQLRSNLKDKSTELEEAQQSLEQCREDLRQKATALAECEQARDDALAKVTESSGYSQSLVESAQTLSQRITDLTSEVNEKQTQIDALMSRLSEAESSVASLTKQLEESQAAFGEKATECETLSGQLTDTQEALDAKTSECDGLLQRLTESGDALGAKTTECDGLTQQLSDARLALSAKTKECTELSGQLAELQNLSSSSKDELQGQLTAKDDEIADLKSKMSIKDSTVSKLSSEIADLHEQLASKDGEITQIREQLAGVRQQLVEAQSVGNEAAISADTQKQALERVLSEKQELEDKLVTAEGKRIELESRIRGLEADLEQERTYRGSVDESNVELTAQNEKLSNTVKQLEDSLVKAKADDELVSRLESDLLEERRRSARLQSEVDVIKRTSGADKASDVRIENVRLKSELEALKSSTVDASEADQLREELRKSREYSAKLELDLVAKDSQISSVQSNVFSQLRNIAIPKGAYDFKFNTLSGNFEKLVCMASGSEESTASVYQVLRATCTANPGKRVVIVDLVTDSCVDKEFGIKKVVSPIHWLTGNEPFKGYLADTRYGHVKVLSTALAYINDLFLMTVDWQSRFAELSAFSADVVVLYVGCLNNLVTKVLFDMFSRVMRSYVIVKATPVNLRTTILNLTGFKALPPTVTVECVNFSDTSSASMYQRLVAKYSAQILRENEVLQL